MTWQDFILKVLTDLSANVAWPIVISVIGYSYRDQFRDFLGRLIKVGPTGAEAVPPQDQQKTTPSIESGAGLLVPDTTSPNQQTDPVLAELEKTIRENLKTNNLDHLAQDAQKDLFVREYAKLSRNYHYDMIAANIFGSQIAALRQLANSPKQTRHALQPIFEQHIQRAKEKNIAPTDFLGWIAFLLNTKLILVDENGNYVIAPMGTQFLELYSSKTNETTRLF